MRTITISYNPRNRAVSRALEGWIEEGSIKQINPQTQGGWTIDNPTLPYNPETDNPSTDGDKWWDIAENRNEVARAAANVKAGRIIEMSRAELRQLMGI